MRPVVYRLDQEFVDKETITVRLIEFDLPQNQEIVAMYNNRAHPHFVLIDGSGEVMQQWFGKQSFTTFEEALANLIN